MLIVRCRILVRPARSPLRCRRKTTVRVLVHIRRRFCPRLGGRAAAGHGWRLEWLRELLARDERMQFRLLWGPALDRVHVQQARHKVNERSTIGHLCETMQ